MQNDIFSSNLAILSLNIHLKRQNVISAKTRTSKEMVKYN